MSKEKAHNNNSKVETKYIYLRIQSILDGEFDGNMANDLSRLMDELADNYFVDTNKKIGEDIDAIDKHS